MERDKIETELQYEIALLRCEDIFDDPSYADTDEFFQSDLGKEMINLFDTIEAYEDIHYPFEDEI